MPSERRRRNSRAARERRAWRAEDWTAAPFGGRVQDLNPRSRSGAEAHRSARDQAEAAEVMEHVRAGVESVLRGEAHDLTPEETEQYFETGQLPERVVHAGELWAERWHASRE